MSFLFEQMYPGNIIHPSALIHPGVKMGTGNIIGPLCIIGYPPELRGYTGPAGKVIIGDSNEITGMVSIDSGSDNFTEIGDECYIMKHSHIGHDVRICNGVTISCGAKVGGHCIIEAGVNLGLNCTIHQRQIIRYGCMVGMGAVVTKGLRTEFFKTYAGNPAKLLGDNSKHPDYTIYKKQFPGE